MGCGLIISEDEFLALPSKQQLLLVFKNQEETKRLVEGYKYWYRVNTTISAILAAGLAYLFNLRLSAIFTPLVSLFILSICL